ncbi:hypothetical protein LPB144_05085 [Christiangramia salexigens]|uniref:Uncharacterized protein n=1 Tax=Christiangramia salexigens TaxID=1913577 RepID=A0A1L3J8C2_9FLAO|nr:hypothetical protein LPB144_05085 [Christiangramia salexigens]
MTHKYYLKSKKEKRKFHFQLASYTLLFLILIFSISYYYGLYFLPFISIWLTLMILAPFIDVPTLVKKEKINYYSQLLLAENQKNNSITIHGGTLFDYYFIFDNRSNGPERKKFILQQYLEGLLNLIKEHEKTSDKNLNIKGTTYIINENTGKKLGFKSNKPDFVQMIILILNYPNLLLTKSIANNKLSFPNLTNIRTYEASLDELKLNKGKIENINNRLKSTIANNGYRK